jgi:hypothetical protein
MPPIGTASLSASGTLVYGRGDRRGAWGHPARSRRLAGTGGGGLWQEPRCGRSAIGLWLSIDFEILEIGQTAC